MVTQQLTIRLDEKELPEIRMVSGDIGREIRIEVYAREDSDTPIDLKTYSAEITIIKPDNTFIMDNFEGDEYELPEQAGAVSGSGYYQIKIFTSGERQIYTGQGPFLVDDMILSDDVIESSSIAFGDRFPEDFATKEWVDDEIAAAGIGTYVAGNVPEEETMPPLVKLQINDDIYPLIHKVEEQEDADITNPAEGDVLKYDADDQKWKNEPLVIPDPTVTKTATGNPIEITDGADAPLVKCTTEIQGSQDLHGYGKPWVGGAGKNKASLSTGNNTVIGQITAGIEYTFSFKATATLGFTLRENNSSGADIAHIMITSGDRPYVTFTASNSCAVYINGYGYAGNAFVDNASEYQIEEGSTATTYAPYSNICPITAYTEGEIEVSDGDGNVTTHTTTYPSAIYRGSEDVVNGEVRSDYTLVDLGSLTWTLISAQGASVGSFQSEIIGDAKVPSSATIKANMVCDCFEVSNTDAVYTTPHQIGLHTDGRLWVSATDLYEGGAAFKTAMSGHMLAYEKSTPTTSSVTPTNLPIKSLSGYTHIESSTGDMEVEYITQQYDPLQHIHYYSTAEQVVGKWVDGSDVKEKTYIYTGTGVANPFTTTIDFTGKSIVEIIPHYVKFTYGGGTIGYCAGSALVNNNSNLMNVAYDDNTPPTVRVTCYIGSGTETYEVAFTIRYI